MPHIEKHPVGGGGAGWTLVDRGNLGNEEDDDDDGNARFSFRIYIKDE